MFVSHLRCLVTIVDFCLVYTENMQWRKDYLVIKACLVSYPIFNYKDDHQFYDRNLLGCTKEKLIKEDQSTSLGPPLPDTINSGPLQQIYKLVWFCLVVFI